MSQCLRCSKSCRAAAVFCDDCRSLLRSQLQQAPASDASNGSSPHVALVAKSEHGKEYGNLSDRITNPHPVVVVSPAEAPTQPLAQAIATYTNIVDQAIVRLNEAAQRIEEVEQHEDVSHRRVPRASRLAPIRDISADIRRESTPLPQLSQTPPESEQGEDLSKRLPDLWPWLPEADTDENENDNWVNATDPLLSRHIPNSAEAAQVEEEDIRRAIAEGLTTAPFSTSVLFRRSRSSRMRIIFSVLAILAVLALLVDGVLLSVAFRHSHTPVHPTPGGPPTLMLSKTTVKNGQSVLLTISHFAPLTSVLLTRDIDEAVQTDTGSAMVNIAANGAASISIIIDDSWRAGFHLLQAEDIKTRITASANLYVSGQGPTRPSQLVIGVTSMNLGPDFEGTNTIQTLKLSNSGGGSISWSVSSNVPWLLISPTQGVFSDNQTISIGGERANLKPGDYSGVITIYSNIAAPVRITVDMTVRPLPPNAGPVLTVTPPVLSFVATDGSSPFSAQVLTVSNPGSRPFSWSLASSTSAAAAQVSLFRALGSQANWLNMSPTSGTVAPGATNLVSVSVFSQNLLPGTYTGTLLFSANGGALDSPQSVSVSLTVQSRCGITTSTGSMTFTAVVGQGNPSNQALTLSATSSCSTTVNWQAVPSTRWLVVTPASGQVKTTPPATTSIGINMTGLQPGKYAGTIAFMTQASTQTVMVTLTIQPPPPPTLPIMGASPLSLNFSSVQGQSNPSNQVVTITNSGGGTLYWHTVVTPLAMSWLNAYPSGGSIPAGQSGQLAVSVDTSQLSPSNYVGQITLYGNAADSTSAGGSPQTIMVNLALQPPCALAQPSSSSLAFSGTVGGGNPSSQTISVTANGSCAWPLLLNSSITSSAPWLTLSPSTGSIKGAGQFASIGVNVNIVGLAPGNYSTQVSLTAIDSSSLQAQGSPEVFSVTLTVFQPCTLQVTPASLSFTVQQGQPSSSQSFKISETGNCARPVSWNATGDSGSSTWLVLSSTSGNDRGRGSTVGVSINPPATLLPGTYNGQITVSASGNGGAVVQNSPQTVAVTLTVTGFTISGTVMACADQTCSTPTPLPSAALTLLSGTNTVATTTADGSGNYSFSGVALGNYTVTASGSDSTGTHYTGSVPLNVVGDQSNFIVKVNQG